MTLNALTAMCIVLLATLAGFFYAFSGTVMPGFDLVAPSTAVEAMQGINVAVRSPHFFVLFFLTPVFCSATAALHLMRGQRRGATLLAIAAGIYLLAGLILTMAINVPMNEALAQIAGDADKAQVWAEYSPDWTFWNHIRTGASALSAFIACLALAYPS
ncbi:MAG: anthrone oxygenase family protein [Pseudomonadota bacterium]